MPTYSYKCDKNGRTLEVSHGTDVVVRNWGELCFLAAIPFNDTDPLTPVRRVIKSAPGVVVQTFDSELRNAGFTKLVKRDEDVYENVTAADDESRFMKKGDPSTMPRIHKKIGD